MNNIYYQICHYCAEYKTSNPSDMNRHLKRKNKCKSNTIFFLKPDTKFIDIMAIKGFRMCEYTQ